MLESMASAQGRTWNWQPHILAVVLSSSLQSHYWQSLLRSDAGLSAAMAAHVDSPKPGTGRHLHHEAAADGVKRVRDEPRQDGHGLRNSPLGNEGCPLLVCEQHALGCVVQAKVGATVHYDALRKGARRDGASGESG